MKSIVTGAAGFIGTHLVESLANDGHEVIGIDDERTGDWGRLRSDCVRIDRDLGTLTEGELRDLAEGAGIVFHLAAEKYNSSKATPARVIETNVSATQRLFWAAADAGAKVVFTSSLYAYGSVGPALMSERDVAAPDTVYGASKLMGEHLLRAAARENDLRWAVARLFFVYGPRQYAEGGYKSVIVKNFERLIRGAAPVIVGDGLQQLDYVYIDDVVAVLRDLALPDNDGVLVNVGTGVGTSICDITDMMRSIAGYPGPAEFAPPDWTAGTRRVADVTRLANTATWAPRDLRSGLDSVWTALQGGGA